MLRWILLDTAAIPGSDETLRLLQRGTEFSINIGRDVLMGSRMRGSEEALARLGCAAVKQRERPRVLIGGFGMGFTLRAALDILPAGADVVVGELLPSVIAWGRGPLAALSSHALDDPRVQIVEGDVGGLIRTARGGYDAILLDVDNGPEALTRPANDGLYSLRGLEAARLALRPGGVLAVWSVAADAAFSQRLRRVGFSIEEAHARAHGGRGARHVVWLATRP